MKKIIIAGKNDIAVDVLNYIIKKKIGVKVFVVPNKTDNGKNVFQKSLKYYANLWQITILTIEEAYLIKDALFLSLEFDRIIDINKFSSQHLYNIHFSLLPAYKGMYTSALPILHDEKETGVTLHKIDNGIDTGDIISQEKIEIKDTDTARDLYIKYIREGTHLIIRNLDDLLSKNILSKPQSAIKSSYYSKKTIDYTNISIDYFKTAYEITKQLQAFSFREYQLPKFRGKGIIGWEILEDKSYQKPGMVLSEINNEVCISTIDYNLLLIYDFYPILWESAKENNIHKVREILTKRVVNLEERNEKGWTALMIAVYNGAYDVVVFLVKSGANLNAHNINGTTVLMYAKSGYLINGDNRIFKHLLEKGADKSPKDIHGKDICAWVEQECPELSFLLENQ